MGSIPTTGSNFYFKSHKEKKLKNEHYNNTPYSRYLENIEEVDRKVPPSMTEVDLIILNGDCADARETVFNGMRNFETKSGGVKDIFSNQEGGVVNAYTINPKGKVVRVWHNKRRHTMPTGDRVTESVYFDQIRLNTITPEIFADTIDRGVRTPPQLRKR